MKNARVNRVAHYLPHATFMLLLFVLFVIAPLVTMSSHTSDAVDATKTSTAIGNCRSLYRADIDAASQDLATAESFRFDVFTDLIEVGRNERKAQIVLARLHGAKIGVAAARAKLAQANDANRRAVMRSAVEPSVFLRSPKCRGTDH